MPQVLWAENMTQEMAPIVKPMLVGNLLQQATGQGGDWSATGRVKLLNSSKVTVWS